MKRQLAEILRPKGFDEVVGQDHILGEESLLRKWIGEKKPVSILLYGPPGCGKTTIASLYAETFSYPFYPLSAVDTSVTEIKKILHEEAFFRQPKILFIDEIHRLNKAQQDLFLPFVEKNEMILIGATTENPSFEINNALLSRLRVFTLHPLSSFSLQFLIKRAEKELHLDLPEKIHDLLIEYSHGDARHLLNLLENLEGTKNFDPGAIEALLQRRLALYDKSDDGHYNLISALHKSVRGSDADAALYWLARMLEAGEDPLFLARRMIRMANEDIGLADPQAASIALGAWQIYHMLGSPEGELALAQAVVYLALAPKSNRIYTAFKKAQSWAKETHHLPPPKHILNAPTAWMKSEGYAKGYEYDHETPHHFSGQNYYPDGIDRKKLYAPHELGFEREMKKRMQYFEKLRRELNN